MRLELEGVAVRDLDTDHDGLPDDWEQFELGSLSGSASDDPDGDGAPNLAEYRSGTDPVHPASVLRVESLTRDSLGRPTLRFPHAASRQYRVEFTEDFQNWSPLTNAPGFELGAGFARWTDEAPVSARRFYRVQVQAP